MVDVVKDAPTKDDIRQAVSVAFTGAMAGMLFVKYAVENLQESEATGLVDLLAENMKATLKAGWPHADAELIDSQVDVVVNTVRNQLPEAYRSTSFQ